MGLFSNIKDSYKRSEASAVLQSYFANQAGAVWGGKETAETLANKLIETTWEMHPAFFDGSYGVRPHKLVLAACTLSCAIDAYGLYSQEADYLAEAFIDIMTNITQNKDSLSLNAVDNTLLISCMPVYNKMVDDANRFLTSIEDQLGSQGTLD